MSPTETKYQRIAREQRERQVKIAEIDHNDEDGVRIELFLVPSDEAGPYHVEDEHGWCVLAEIEDREDAEQQLRWRYGDPLWRLTFENQQ